MRIERFALTLSIVLVAAVCLAEEVDPYLWLEDVEGDKALEWVKQRSKTDTAELEAVPQYAPIHEKLLKIFNAKDRIPNPEVRGPWIYNFWQDADHVRGIWRRTTRDQYVTESPSWETVIDVDQLAKDENENWVWHGANGLPPKYDRFMVTLSRGGGDASVIREFDATTKAFVKDGFSVPEAKSDVSWRDENTLWLGTDFGEGSLTASGYPRFAKMWKRGTPLTGATTVLDVPLDYVGLTAYSIHNPEGRYDMVSVTPEFFRGTNYIMRNDKLVKLDIPEDAELQGIFKKQLMLSLRTDWTTGGKTYPQDALLAIDLDEFLGGGRNFSVLFKPQERVALGAVSNTKNYLLVTTLDNVKSRLYEYTLAGKEWKSEEIALPGLGSAGVTGASDEDDVFYVGYNDFLTPSSLYIVRDGKKLERIKNVPAEFDATGMKVEQREAVSKDGTKIPYFVFMPKGFKAGQPYPTLLYGYGGFEISMRPNYSGTVGSSWVERGGVYVLANIRGGGEFGPQWHQAAMKENHQNCFDDFIAVAEDLIKTQGHLAGSTSASWAVPTAACLVGACFTQRPELFKAVVCQVPLLDMKRYSHLLAGNSWMAEYGNPDTDDWNYMQKWSPYQNLDANEDLPQGLLLHVDARRPRASRPRAQDGQRR